MGLFQEYENYDAIALAELVRQGDISSAELLETAIDRIEKYNPRLNAVITLMVDQASEAVKNGLPEGPFQGVPFLLKDLLAAYTGVPLTNGSKAFSDYVPDHDSELVTRFKKSGLVILGKTNTPEFGLMGVTEPDLHGATCNPWNPDHTPGGSSGGSGAAIAAGMVPIASAGDGGGSIRIPAAHCGLFGLKPSRGRVPTGPDHGELWQGATVEHILSRSVRDSAAMLDAINGADCGSPYTIVPPERPYLKELEVDPGSLRIAYNTESPLGTPVDQSCIEAVTDTALLLEKMGHKLEEAKPQLDGVALAKSYLMMYFGEIAADAREIPKLIGRNLKKDDFELITRIFKVLGNAYSAGDFVLHMREWGKASRIMGKFHQKYDLYLTPTAASPPVKIGELKPSTSEVVLMKLVSGLNLGKTLKASGIVDQLAIKSLSKTPFTQLANLTGQPAMSVPLHWSGDGLPIGVQLIAPFGDEATLFRLAAQLEKEKPWFAKRPVLSP